MVAPERFQSSGTLVESLLERGDVWCAKSGCESFGGSSSHSGGDERWCVIEVEGRPGNPGEAAISWLVWFEFGAKVKEVVGREELLEGEGVRKWALGGPAGIGVRVAVVQEVGVEGEAPL